MFAKIFTQIFDSSIVEQPEVRFTFMDLLVLCDANGVVDMTHEAIARRTNRPIEVVRESIATLEAPDTRSRTPDSDGRRLIRLDAHRDWGWFIVNYERFRMTASEEQRREKTRDRVHRHRATSQNPNEMPPNEPCNAPVTQCNADVTLSNACNAMQKQKQKQMKKELEGEASSQKYPSVASLPAPPRFIRPTIEQVKLQAAKIGLSDSEAEKFFNYYESNGWRVGRNPMKSLPHAMANWRKNETIFAKPSTSKPTSFFHLSQ